VVAGWYDAGTGRRLAVAPGAAAEADAAFLAERPAGC
jgi:hypothetical protein